MDYSFDHCFGGESGGSSLAGLLGGLFPPLCRRAIPEAIMRREGGTRGWRDPRMVLGMEGSNRSQEQEMAGIKWSRERRLGDSHREKSSNLRKEVEDFLLFS